MGKDDCVQTRNFESGKMTVKICTMLDSCDCGGPDCCSKKGAKK